MSASRARALAVASDPVAAAAATELLVRGNAVDAIVAGVLAAAGEHPGVLLGPVQILVGGPGVGLRAIDGRVRQPGKGVARPRGFLPEDTIPRAARVGVPALPAALAAALASFGKSTSWQVASHGLDRASAVPARKAVLARLAQRGPSALADDQIAGDLIAAVGRHAGGVVSLQDLEELRPTLDPCTLHDVDGRRLR
jgi:gamma-glutamyltranspeptidase